MSNNTLMLRPSYWACVSGGKDSLYMLNLILHNLEKYPLNGVVHFELEIDYPFIHDVIDYMESECKRFGIPFVRIKPRRTWEEWYYNECTSKTGKQIIYGFPTRQMRWCNDKYKLDAGKQLEEFMNSRGCYTVRYIGYCADEESRFEKRKNKFETEVYPIVEAGINESEILEWAKSQPIFNHYYETQRRCGCMYCPLSSMINLAYLYKYYPDNFSYMMDKVRETERIKTEYLGKPFTPLSANPKYNADYTEEIIKKKWLPILEKKEREYEQSKYKDIVEIKE